MVVTAAIRAFGLCQRLVGRGGPDALAWLEDYILAS